MTNSYRALPSAVTSSIVEAVYGGSASGTLDLNAFPVPELTLRDGLEAQLAVLDSRLAAGARQSGWKVGLTSGPARDKMGAGFRPFGYILESTTYTSGQSVPRVPHAGLEPEIGFRFDRSVAGGDVTADDIRASIAGVVPAFEIQQTRLPKAVDHGILLADNLSQWGLVLGETAPWTSTAAETVVELHEGTGVYATIGPNFEIDEPMESLAALCRTLSDWGRGIESGQVVITGAFAKASITKPGDWSASFSTAGDVAVRFE